jgi:septal ring factor EnvC (AmiA/AmiB activator)
MSAAELFSYIMPVATFISIIVGIIAITKAIMSISKELADFKIEMTKELASFKIETNERLSKIESKLDIQDERQVATNSRVDKIETEFKEFKTDVKEQRTENQKITNKFIDVIADSHKNAAVL